MGEVQASGWRRRGARFQATQAGAERAARERAQSRAPLCFHPSTTVTMGRVLLVFWAAVGMVVAFDVPLRTVNSTTHCNVAGDGLTALGGTCTVHSDCNSGICVSGGYNTGGRPAYT